MDAKLEKHEEELVAEIIKHKSLAAKIAYRAEYQSLIDTSILSKSDEGFVKLTHSAPATVFIAAAFLKDKNLSLEVASLEEGVALAKKIIKSITSAGVTSGTHEFRNHLLKEIIIASFKPENGVGKQILTLDFEKTFYEVVDSITLALLEVPVTPEQAYRIFRYCYQKHEGGHPQISRSIEAYSGKYGKELIAHALKDRERPAGFIANILAGYYPKAQMEVLQHLAALAGNGEDREVAIAINHLPIKYHVELKEAINLLNAISPESESKGLLVLAYATLISSALATEEDTKICVERIYLLAGSKDSNVERNIAYRLVDLKIPDETKCDIVSKFDYQRTDSTSAVAHLLQSINPVLSFPVFRLMSAARKMKFDPGDFAYTLSANYQKFPVEFSDELVKMLTDKIGFVRYGGCKILQEMESENNPFEFKVDLHSYPERTQLIFMDSIMIDFLHPDKVIKFLLMFRKSSFQSVLQAMINNCAFLIEDYTGDAMEAFRKILDKNVQPDKQVLQIVEKYYKDLVKIIETKHGILELSPQHNQARLYNFFTRMSRDRLREQVNIDHGSDKNSIFSLASKVMIARGRLWKLGDKEPSPLHHISRAITMPRNYYLNPDEYNWNIQARIITNFNG